MSLDLNSADDYQVGGSLPLNAPTYVIREADFDFYKGVQAGKFCYILNSRQMGKSSLLVQTMQRLQAAGVVCTVVDLTAIGSQDTTPDQWYAGIIYTLAINFNLLDKFNIRTWLDEHQFLGPVQRLGEFISQVLLKEIPQNIAIFVDEIDTVLSLNFRVDDFFALIRSCYDKRAYQSEYNRLTWALLGVATPSELIQDKNRTPFNIGQAIQLSGFQMPESQGLAKGLAPKANDPQALLREILAWTGGKPFLTQKLCKLVLTSWRNVNNDVSTTIPAGQEAEWVAQLVQKCIIDNWEAQDEPEHLKTIRDRLLRNAPNTSRKLALYQNILLTPEVSADDSPEEMELRLAGLVLKQQGKLKVYNRIYKLIFDTSWVEQELEKRFPYHTQLAAWLAADCLDESQLLRGKQLQDALAWTADKKLSPQQDKFLKESQQKTPEIIRLDDSSKGSENRSKNSDEQLIYDHFLYCVQQESPEELIQRFDQLFIDGMGYPDPDIEAALYRIIAFLDSEQEFKYLLTRCCYILLNRWQSHSQYQAAITNLVNLFKQSSSRFQEAVSRSHLVRRLQELIQFFTLSQEYLALQGLVEELPPDPHLKEGSPALGQLICRYPYLYTHCLLPQDSSYEHRQTIRNIQAQKQRQFEVNLSQYIPYLVRRIQFPSQSCFNTTTEIIQPISNPTLLSDDELHLAIQQFVGKAEESKTYRDLAQVFLNHTKQTQSYRAFKSDLYEYLIASIEQKYGKHKFNDHLYKYLKNTFPENDSHKLNDFLIMRTCSQLFEFLVESPQHPNYYLFIDLISNLGPVRTIGLLLKIVLLSNKVKPHLEKRFSILFNHYESQTVDDILWLVKSLENLHVALVTNFGAIDLSFIEKNIH